MKIKHHIKSTVVALVLLVSAFGFSQDFEKERLESERKAKDLVYEANTLVEKDNFVAAEMEYRKAISQQENSVVGTYNLAHSYYKKGNFDEAMFRNQEAAKNATTKAEKHNAYHNIGNILMKNKKCKEAVEAFKNALRNNPTDEETRYNFALAKDCAEQQDQDGGGDDNKEDDKKEDQKDKDDQKKEDEKKEDEKKEDKEKDKKEEEGDEDKKKGDDEKDEEGKPKDKKKEDKGDKEKEQKQQKPQPGKMSPQQIKNILEAMNNQEQKVQQKINAKKQKGARIKTEKDW